MNTQKIVLQDDRGRDYVVEDIIRFYQHILDYHAAGVSLHEEYGYYFTVDDAFREKIEQLVRAQGSDT